MRIGWLFDAGHYMGGAEMAAAELAQRAPSGVRVVACPPGGVPDDLDGYVVHNCTSYRPADMQRMAGRKVVKVQHDVWPYGDTDVRLWLLQNATLFILGSPVQHEAMIWDIQAPVKYAPQSVDLAPFREAARRSDDRRGCVWIGRLFDGKGLPAARQWAIDHGVTIDVYGYGPLEDQIRDPLIYKGKLAYEDVPETLARYETFVFLPTEVEPYNRATVEAYAAGCELVINGNVGPLWWIQNNPAAMEHAHERVWSLIMEAVA